LHDEPRFVQPHARRPVRLDHGSLVQIG
jgi:hypothetical protein